MKKLFVFDCDGTLINDEREINSSNIDMINKITDMGHIVCLCTGRNYHQLEKYLSLMPKIELVGSLNGTCIHRTTDNKILYQGKSLSKELINDVLEIAKKLKREVHWTNKDQKMYRVYFGTTPTQDIIDDSFFKYGTKNPKYDNWLDVKDDLFNNEIVQISPKIEYSKVLEPYNFLKKKYHDTRICDITLSSNVYIDITPVNCNKASAVKFFQQYYNINNQNTYCFGDSDNDILMMKEAINGIGMFDSTPNLKYYCRTIIGDNNSDAIAHTLEQIINTKHPLKQLEPSLLAFNLSKIKEQLLDCKKVGINYIHYDVMDEYVNNKSFDNEWLDLINECELETTIHFMVYKPIEWISRFIKYTPFAITFQFEPLKEKEVFECLDLIKTNKIKTGIAIKPNSTETQFQKYLDHIDFVTIMSVEPGKGGQGFDESCLNNLQFVYNYRQQHNLKYLIQIDGGIKIENVDKIKSMVDFFVSGTGFINLNQQKQIEFINKIKERE